MYWYFQAQYLPYTKYCSVFWAINNRAKPCNNVKVKILYIMIICYIHNCDDATEHDCSHDSITASMNYVMAWICLINIAERMFCLSCSPRQQSYICIKFTWVSVRLFCFIHPLGSVTVVAFPCTLLSKTNTKPAPPPPPSVLRSGLFTLNENFDVTHFKTCGNCALSDAEYIIKGITFI